MPNFGGCRELGVIRLCCAQSIAASFHQASHDRTAIQVRSSDFADILHFVRLEVLFDWPGMVGEKQVCPLSFNVFSLNFLAHLKPFPKLIQLFIAKSLFTKI